MPIVLQVFVIAFCIALLFYVLHLVAREQLLLKYSLLWLLLAVILLIAAIFPKSLFSLSELFGFETTSNFIFGVGLFCLLAITWSLSVIVSKQTIKLKNLTQRLALIEHDLLQEKTKSREE